MLDRIEEVVIGKRPALELVLIGLLARGHVLLEDNPGLGKSLIARSFAQALELDYKRIQFTPDLLPSDITGSFIYDQRTQEFNFRAGPVFTNILLADEINRTPPKTQAALLEVMQEQQVTVEGSTMHVESPFTVLATQNPVEYEGTYPLPEAQLDRFLLRVRMGYLSPDDEYELLRRRMERRVDDVVLQPVLKKAEVLALQEAVETVYVEESVSRYIVALTAATRAHPSVLVGASPRGALALMKLARGRALLAGRAYVTPDDVKAVAVPALGHRIVLRPEMWVRQMTGDLVVVELLGNVTAPAAVG
ncbi:MAG: MoxR-like ATPase [Frankiaceae bacterium]|nr:MoxR-like ATPase [Frankiaceae bacterium]MDQ1714734.1 MoxR-like ATPase [Frankiaceae bacterium]MDQ1725343.1 MoxR-like ATPase [Frankiaceae bacterium]